MHLKSVLTGAGAAIAARALLPKLLVVKFGRDVRRLNAGDYSTLLRAYADDAVLHFAEGEHRWSGDWVGKAAIERFLKNFTAAKVQGKLRQVAVSGPPWALMIWARFDDFVNAADGTPLYENRTVLVMRTRWGKIVDHEDFYADTARIAELDHKLTALGVAPVPKPTTMPSPSSSTQRPLAGPLREGNA